MGRTRSRGRKHPRRRNCSAACCLLPFTPLLGYWYWYYRGPHRHHQLQQRLRGITAHSHRNTSVLFEQDHTYRRKPFAVATLLTTMPSSKNDGWTPRSVGKKEQGDMCPRSKAVCAVLVLADSVRRLGGLGDTYDFVALVDRETPLPLYESLVKHNIVIEQMLFGPHRHVFDSYLLLRKLYVFKMDQYLRVLLLDIDGVVTGSLRFLFEAPLQCDKKLIAPSNERYGACNVVDHHITCQQGNHAELIAQQTSGTPVLTAYLMAVPSKDTFYDIGQELDKLCGGHRVCDRKRIHRVGWGDRAQPHNWATRNSKEEEPSWASMGAGFSDQGFVEYFFGLERRTAKLVSKWSCPRRLHYLHFNVPPKPWQCPDSPKCDAGMPIQWDAPKETRSFGGHHCAKDWWWQFASARPRLKPFGCAAHCLRALDASSEKLNMNWHGYASMPRCDHLWEDPYSAGGD
jgi:hypothetical protein